jgi:hypothetical protein
MSAAEGGPDKAGLIPASLLSLSSANVGTCTTTPLLTRPRLPSWPS